jgi:hypothetical protein
MVATFGLDLVLLAALIGVWFVILRTAKRLAVGYPPGDAPRPHRPIKGLTIGGMVLWFISANIPDPSLRSAVFYLGWAVVFGDAAWYLWALRRLDRRAPRNLD